MFKINTVYHIHFRVYRVKTLKYCKMKEIKVLIFDLDGVLVSSRHLHYVALNKALIEVDPKYEIGYEEHLAKYDGHPTKYKLKQLTKDKELPAELYDIVWERKQYHTIQSIPEVIVKNDELIEMFKVLSEKYKIYCASNAIYKSIINMLHYCGIDIYFDYIISNEEVANAKPNPEIYLKCIIHANVDASSVLIFEDSDVGRKAAYSSGAHVCPVVSLNDISLKNVTANIKMAELKNTENIDIKWKKPINIVIPMAGAGSRFSQAGYTFPKPLIDVNGKPMIQVVVNNLNIDGRYIFIVRKEHVDKYNISMLLKIITNNKCEIIEVDSLTEGAACSVLLAKEFIDNDTPLLIANSDQYMEWNSNRFLYCMSNDKIDGGILTFKNNHPKWSYARVNDDGFVVEVKEKEPISEHATVGVYYWAKGSEFVRCAEQMIRKDIRVNNEFYTCPVYNESIQENGRIKIHDCDEMWGLGTPEDLQNYLRHHLM